MSACPRISCSPPGRSRRKELAGLAGEATAVTGFLATALAAADIAGQVHSSQYLNAGLSTFDFALGFVSSRAGPLTLAADTLFNGLGGSKAIAKEVAKQICAVGGGNPGGP